jgi:outer membrane protein
VSQILKIFFVLILLALVPRPVMAQTAMVQTQNLSLTTTLEGLPKSPAWKMADLAVQNVERQLQTSLAAAGLTLNVTADYGLSYQSVQPSDPALPQATQQGVVGVNASITVLPWSPAWVAVRAAERALARAVLEREDTRNNLKIQLAERYFATCQLETDAQLAGTNQTIVERKLEISKKRFEQKLEPQENVLSARAAFEDASAKEKQAINSAQLSRRILFNLLGQPVTNVKLETPPSKPPTPAKLEALIERGLKIRPDIQRAVSSLNDASEALEAANRERYIPASSLSLSVGPAGQQSGATSGLTATGKLDFSSGTLSGQVLTPLIQTPGVPSNGTQISLNLAVSLPLIAPSADARVSTAKIALDTARANLESLKLSAELEIRQRYSELETGLEALQALETNLEAARKRSETFKAKLEAGTITALDLEQQQLVQRQAERDFESGVAAAQIAGFKLENAVGELRLAPKS